MKQFTFTSILVAVAVAAFSLGASNHRTVSASGLAGMQGRYQITQTTILFTTDGVDGHAPMPVMVDTVTGRTWQYEGPITSNKKNGFLKPGGWDEVDYESTIMGVDGKVFTKYSHLPIINAKQ